MAPDKKQDSAEAAVNAPGTSRKGENFRTIVLAVLLAMIFRSFFFQPFHIPSGSMKSNFLIGDYLFVSKYAYGYSRFSFPFAPPVFEGRIMATEPKRGDVIVFRLPRDNSTDYIKRLIGLPGDHIQVKDGVIYLNGTAIPKTYVDTWNDESFFPPKEIKRYRETLPEGVSYLVLDETEEGSVDNTQEYIVPEGHYFFMGDNRDNSVDSRYNKDYGFPPKMHVGFVPFENLVGRAEIIVFSWESLFSFREGRFFKEVH